MNQRRINNVKRRTRAERDKDAEFEFLLKHSQPTVEAILKDETKPTPEEIAAAFGPNPTDENCGEGTNDNVHREVQGDDQSSGNRSVEANAGHELTARVPIRDTGTPAVGTNDLRQSARRTGISEATENAELAVLDPGALTFELQAISRKPLTRMVVEEAREWDSKAKAYLEGAEKSEVRQKITDLFKQHKFWLSKFSAAVDPIKRGREAVSKLFAQWERKRLADAAEQRRKDEAAAIALQEAARKADVAHLKVLGHVTEAKELATAPLPPVVLPEPKNPPGRVEGVTVIPVWKLDPLNPVTDYRALYHYIADHPELWYHQELSPSRWKRTLTDAKGKTDIPGINVVEDTETRNRG